MKKLAKKVIYIYFIVEIKYKKEIYFWISYITIYLRFLIKIKKLNLKNK